MNYLCAMQGEVIKSTGKWYKVLLVDGTIIQASIKGKLRLEGLRTTNPIAAGDVVNLKEVNDDLSNIAKSLSVEFFNTQHLICKGEAFCSNYIDENIISYENVITIINNENLSQDIRDRFHFLLTNTIISNYQISDIIHQYYTNVKDKIIEDDDGFDTKKLEFFYDYKHDDIIISYKHTLLDDAPGISPEFLTEKIYGISVFKYKLNMIYLSDIINLCSELGIKVLNIIDWSCRTVSLNYEPDNDLAYDDSKVIELHEREFAETNINSLLGGKIKRKKNLVKRKKKTNKKGKNHNMKKSHKNNKTKRRKIKK